MEKIKVSPCALQHRRVDVGSRHAQTAQRCLNEDASRSAKRVEDFSSCSAEVDHGSRNARMRHCGMRRGKQVGAALLEGILLREIDDELLAGDAASAPGDGVDAPGKCKAPQLGNATGLEQEEAADR